MNYQDQTNKSEENINNQEITCKPVPLIICPTHTPQNWTEHHGYIYKNSEVTCRQCGWGAKIPGYYRVVNGKVFDLRSINQSSDKD